MNVVMNKNSPLNNHVSFKTYIHTRKYYGCRLCSVHISCNSPKIDATIVWLHCAMVSLNNSFFTLFKRLFDLAFHSFGPHATHVRERVSILKCNHTNDNILARFHFNRRKCATVSQYTSCLVTKKIKSIDCNRVSWNYFTLTSRWTWTNSCYRSVCFESWISGPQF